MSGIQRGRQLFGPSQRVPKQHARHRVEKLAEADELIRGEADGSGFAGSVGVTRHTKLVGDRVRLDPEQGAPISNVYAENFGERGRLIKENLISHVVFDLLVNKPNPLKIWIEPQNAAQPERVRL